MFKKKSILLAILLFQMLIFTVSSATAFDIPKLNASIKGADTWVTYTDPRFGFSMDYPANWYLIPRDDSDPEGTSGFIMITPVKPESTSAVTNPNNDLVPYIAVGLYLAELEAEQSLIDWTELYEKASNGFDEKEMQRGGQESLTINGANAIRKNGISPITEFQFTNLSHGKTVWFIWTNISNLVGNPYSEVYEHMINSFRFGKNTPVELNDVYGNQFRPLRLDKELPESNLANHPTPKLLINAQGPVGLQIFALSSSWKSPVVGMYNVQCGSAAHTGKAEYAADIGTPMNTSVYAAYSGNVIFAGWNTKGYGNLIKTSSSDGKTAYYAHLNTINTNNGANIITKQFIARSGNSGPSDIHLHFHVNYTNLTGMSGFYPNTPPPPPGEVVYPSMTDASCGDMGR